MQLACENSKNELSLVKIGDNNNAEESDIIQYLNWNEEDKFIGAFSWPK